jgi:hypothetical protein
VSTTNRKFILAYIVLVGLPLLGMAAALRSGRHLTAPISVDGAWKIEANLASIGNRSCASLVSSVLSSPLVISQSGPNLVVSSASAKTSSGTIDGNNLRIPLVPAADSGCGSDQTIALAAVVDSRSDPGTLTGFLTATDCTACAPIGFHAIKQPKPQAAGAH